VAEICRAQLAAGIIGDTPEKAQEERFWVKASLAEADLGSGDQAAKQRLEAAAIEENAKEWMIETARDQLGKRCISDSQLTGWWPAQRIGFIWPYGSGEG
jgi:hypothetical protein